MAYSAAVSLTQILQKLMHSDQLLIPYPKSQIESLHEKVSFLQSFLKKKNLVPDSVHELETQMIDAICEAEDIIESHMSIHLLSPEYENASGYETFTEKLLQVLKRFESIKEIAENFTEDIDRSREDQRTRPHSEPFILSRFLVRKKKLVGIEDECLELMDILVGHQSHLTIVAVVGMMGIGKTTLVKQVYDDPIMRNHFDNQLWISIGPNCHVRDIQLDLLRSLNPHFHPGSSENELARIVHMNLYRRFLIVLDNICDVKVWDGLNLCFPNRNNGSRIIVTSRLTNVTQPAALTPVYHRQHQRRFLNENESWDLLRYAAIGEDYCPPQLEKIGKTIAQNCQGLPLKIVVLGSLLSRMSPDPEMWSKVADNRHIQNREMLKFTQNLEHEQIPQHIKACFLYMIAFPQYQHIPTSKLFMLWVAEGFLELTQHNTLEEVAEQCLEDLNDRSLVLVHEFSPTNRIKTCSIHSAIWPFYDRVAAEHKIFKAIENYKDSADATHRRFSIYKNVLFAIEDVHKSIASVSTTRSLLCTGPYHPYRLRLILNSKLLRVLDALSIRFYEFPVEIVKLVLLRFLAITLNRVELPASVSNLQKLQFLIVRRHASIKPCGAPCFLPMEIWKMHELRHLQVEGNDLPTPCDVNDILPNLTTLSNAGALSCTIEVLQRIPNLKKLGIRIELAWDADSAPLHMFDHLAILEQLETFKYVVVNPVLGPEVAVLPDSVSVFPSSLRKITLSGCEFPWRYMSLIGGLPNLEVLKLRCNAFRGPEWEVNEDEFCSLRFLQLEDLDIRYWKTEVYGKIFRRLERLAIHHCYKLHAIPSELGDILTLETIEMVDCNPSAVESAMLIKEEQLEYGNEELRFRIHSAWTDDGKLKYGRP